MVVEAEDMQLCGYRIENNANASEGQVIKGSACKWASAKTTFDGPEGTYDLKLSVLDECDGNGRICVSVNGQWVLDTRLNQNDGGNGVSNSTFRVIEINDIDLNPGDVVKIWGLGNRGEYARIDKLEFCGEAQDPMTAELGDTVWFDVNKDGVRDANEAGMANVTVLLQDADGNTLDQTQTDASGNYLFSGLAAGDYKVSVVAPAAFAFTTKDAGGNEALDSDANANGMTDVITLATGESNLDVDAGLVDPATASISGTYFCDENGNAVEDAGDVVLSGQTVTLLRAGTGPYRETTTDVDGNYTFADLDAGTYWVMFGENAEGKTFVDADQGTDDTIDSDVTDTGLSGRIDLAMGGTVTDIDAGVADPGTASVAGRVFCDENDNDVDDNEGAVDNVVVTLLTASGAFVAETTTAADGSYSFTGLDAGDYKVAFDTDTLDGKTLVAQDAGNDDAIDSDVDANGETGVISLEIGEAVGDVDAGVEVPVGSISGTYFCDENTNGVDDAGDTDVANQQVILLNADATGIVKMTTTDAQGNYSFADLEPGDYRVVFQPAADKEFVAKNAGNDDTDDSDVNANGMTDPVTVVAGQNSADVDAGVAAVNAAPVALDDMIKTCGDMAKSVDLLDNDTDADGDILTVLSIADADEIVFVGETLTLESGATVTLNADGTTLYDPNNAHDDLLAGTEYAEETVTYTVFDGQDGIAEANLNITACGTEATLQMICDALPEQVNLSIAFDGINFAVSVVDGAGSSDDGLASGIWAGACVDFKGQLILDQELTANVYGPCETLPTGLVANPENLDNITWILNQEFVGQDNMDGTDTYDVFDIQEAIWTLSDGTASSNADANEIAAKALADGEGFVAGEGDLVGVVFDPIAPDASVTNTQTFIMGVDWDAIDLDCIC